ncbi:GNAT family N-acetyltransferase [Guptibacillus algicola]|uniref:GNAT family N-acetyltransferase n=1 Tax=Guptibacillus algicola TaxID=225844 RepID=UPI001CD1956F|nr:GNAT family N-acetyltransferase [Alkalihalobacillus algicola]MCA0987519.1 GNAT family N-acetyltransferase [Alkalihalobacillus algicola]
MITLRKMTSSEFTSFLDSAVERYADEKVKSNNWNQREARLKAEAEYHLLLPLQENTENHYLYTVSANDEAVIGSVWVELKENDKAFIRDFHIHSEHQGNGLGKAAMKEIERVGEDLGVKKIGLHVFGHNTIARGLYETLGYETTNVMMIKSL